MSARTVASRISLVGGCSALAAGVATTLARSIDSVPGVAADTWAMVTAFTDLGALAYATALVGLVVGLALRFRRRWLVVVGVTAALTAIHLSWIVPAFVADTGRSTGPQVRLLAQNLYFGEADTADLVSVAADADVVVLTEITAPAADRLREAGIGQRFRYEAGGTLPRTGATGTRIYSRYPVSASQVLDPGYGEHTWLARLDVPGLGALTVVAAHPSRPVRDGSDWLGEQQALRRSVPHERTVVAGDFNAVDSHPGQRGLVRDGFRDADDVVGAGWTPTYPAEGRVPPLIGIDHVLLSPDLTATAYQRVDLADTDHRGVLATIALRG